MTRRNKGTGTSLGTMRVLFVLPRMVAGGVERATLNLIDGLQRQGVDCRLALGRCRGELLAEAQRLTVVEEIAELSKWLFIIGLIPILRRYRPTHIITAFADVSLMTLVACRLARSHAAVIVGVHGTHGVDAAKGGWRVRFQYRLYNRVAGIVYRRCAAVVAVSNGVAADVREHYPLTVPRLSIIHNPVLTVSMRQHIAQLPLSARAGMETPYRLVAVGRLAYEKGFDVLLLAMPAIAACFDVQLRIYGEGAERERLQSLIGVLDLQHHVQLMGNTLDPWSAISAADLFVFPSRHEGFGVALVEALACGQQIVASDCPHGPAEILQAGALGQLVPPEDPVSLAEAVCRSLGGITLFASGRLRARAEDFAAEAAVADYLALLRRLASPLDD
jgi:glycosyltransferase involved in cell wall biosynthesis